MRYSAIASEAARCKRRRRNEHAMSGARAIIELEGHRWNRYPSGRKGRPEENSTIGDPKSERSDAPC